MSVELKDRNASRHEISPFIDTHLFQCGFIVNDEIRINFCMTTFLQTDWNREARRLLQIELARKDIGIKELSRALEIVCGVEIDPRVLSNKIGRGAFSVGFFLQCMKALGVKNISLPD